MPRYINVDSALQAHPEFLNEQIDDHDKAVYAKGWNACNSAYYDAIKEIDSVSPDEARGVVHCYECKFWRRPPSCEGLARCETGETGIRYRSKNDFCSRGAKMEVSEDA